MELRYEMELDAAEDELVTTAAPPGERGPGRCPLESPDVQPITEELLIAPHPDEPGVDDDGVGAPLENPGSFPAPDRAVVRLRARR
jgi:hypothetical protein